MKKKLLISLILALSAVSAAVAQDSLVPEHYTFSEQNPQATKLALVSNLPHSSWQQTLANVVQVLLGFTGSLALIAFTVGGIMFVTAQGNEEKVTKAKKILTWSLIALVIIASSFGIVVGISQLEFFQ